MSSTTRYQQLCRELLKARKAFLPTTFNPMGDYPERQSDRARGFLLVAHAEIESFFEDRVRESAQLSVNLWRTRKRIITGLASLLAYIFVEENEPRWKDINFRINYAHDKFNKSVRANNGVKIENLKRLLTPIGSILMT